MLTFFIRSALHSGYKELLSVKLMLTCGLQDDFAPPAEKLPIHPVHNVQDWDDPEGEFASHPIVAIECFVGQHLMHAGAVEWNLMQEAMQHIRSTGELPPELKSHDSLNILDPVPVKQETCVSLSPSTRRYRAHVPEHYDQIRSLEATVCRASRECCFQL